ncbi:MAG: hypothetical protein M1836_005941 [Candelina mexicana]|nr:MAG: hypothetical protein M1836_005941 [Candelina mexicana]
MNYQPAYNQTPLPTSGLAQYQNIRRDVGSQAFQEHQQLPQQMHVNGPQYAQSQPYPYTQYSGVGTDKSTAWSPAGGMMQPGLNHRMGINQPYTNSPYSQPTATPGAVTTQRHEQRTPLPPSQPRDDHHSLSPQGSDITQNSQNFSNPQQQTKMAAPPPPQSQPQAPPAMQAQNAPQKPILQPPLSPSSAKREKERVALLLEINRDLLQEVVFLQSQGKAGSIRGIGPNQSAQQAKEDDKDNEQKQSQYTSKEFIECMRRLQANLAYLAGVVDRVYKPAKDVPTSPAMMEAPPNSPALEVLYSKLRELFPNAKTHVGSTPNQGQKAAIGPTMTQQTAVTSTS